MAREALIERNTKETQIRLQLNIDGTLEMRSVRQLGTKKESNVMAAVFFPWMKFWCSVQWIFPEDLILDGMQRFLRKK